MVTGTVKSTDVVLSVVAKNSGGEPIPARFAGKVDSSTRMAGQELGHLRRIQTRLQFGFPGPEGELVLDRQ